MAIVLELESLLCEAPPVAPFDDVVADFKLVGFEGSVVFVPAFEDANEDDESAGLGWIQNWPV